jgi:hypothetical protein
MYLNRGNFFKSIMIMVNTGLKGAVSDEIEVAGLEYCAKDFIYLHTADGAVITGTGSGAPPTRPAQTATERLVD